MLDDEEIEIVERFHRDFVNDDLIAIRKMENYTTLDTVKKTCAWAHLVGMRKGVRHHDEMLRVILKDENVDVNCYDESHRSPIFYAIIRLDASSVHMITTHPSFSIDVFPDKVEPKPHLEYLIPVSNTYTPSALASIVRDLTNKGATLTRRFVYAITQSDNVNIARILKDYDLSPFLSKSQSDQFNEFIQSTIIPQYDAMENCIVHVAEILDVDIERVIDVVRQHSDENTFIDGVRIFIGVLNRQKPISIVNDDDDENKVIVKYYDNRHRTVSTHIEKNVMEMLNRAKEWRLKITSKRYVSQYI